jgi:carboxylesterase
MSKKTIGALILHGFSGKPIGLQGISPPLKALEIPHQLPTLRGHDAESPNALLDIHWQEWIRDGEKALCELLTETEKVIIIGHSMGGWIALNLAIEHPDKIDSIIIAAASTRAVSPFGPGGLLHFLVPLHVKLKKKWKMPPVFADPEFITHGQGYEWVPTKTWRNVFDFMKATEKRLPQFTTPILILHSKNDSSNSPQGAVMLYNSISTLEDQKKIIWFERTEHDMFNDCEKETVIKIVMDYVKERIEKGAASYV